MADTHTHRRGAGGGSEGLEPEYCKDLLSNLLREGRWLIKKSVAFALHIVGAVVNLCTLIQLVQTQGTVFLRRSIHFSDAPEFLRCSTKIDPTTVDLSDAVIISQMLRENVLEWLTYLYHSHQFYILYGMGDSSRWSASDHRQLLRSHRHA